MGVISDTMPLMAAQNGVWDGEYVHLDADHKVIDRHRSRLLCRVYDGGPDEARLVQSNLYDWADGNSEVRYFEGRYRDGRLWISNELIDGWTGEIELDETRRSLMVAWVRTAEPDFRFYELITMSEDGLAKNRTWHWYRKGRLFQRTLINETLTTRDWTAHDRPEYHQYRPRGQGAD